jgi:hypothetical protein
MTTSPAQHIGVQKPTPGMSRFFSPTNLDRYRRLASGALGEAEQHRLLQDLAEEMKAFRREARVDSINRPTAFTQNIVSQASGLGCGA